MRFQFTIDLFFGRHLLFFIYLIDFILVLMNLIRMIAKEHLEHSLLAL
jgi:hypothetical protein